MPQRLQHEQTMAGFGDDVSMSDFRPIHVDDKGHNGQEGEEGRNHTSDASVLNVGLPPRDTFGGAFGQATVNAERDKVIMNLVRDTCIPRGDTKAVNTRFTGPELSSWMHSESEAENTTWDPGGTLDAPCPSFDV